MSAAVLVLYNPVSGDSTAKEFFENHVLPYLDSNGIRPAAVMATEHAGHAGTIVTDFLQKHQGEVTIVLGSGDGTLHEVVNALSGRALDTTRAITFALVPCGTANALFSSLFPSMSERPVVSYKLLSLDAFIARAKPKPLALARTTLYEAPTRHVPCHGIVSVVVTSTALHASILEDSELLRKEIPGIERFKVAAQQNKTRWYRSRVKLSPVPSTGAVQVYDPDTNALVPHKGSLELSGPFVYFLSTVNVDRLEPAFRIAPQFSAEPPEDASLDVVIVRPQRDPTFTSDTPQTREAFATKAFTVLIAAYQDGNHIRLRYKENGDISADNDGPTVVEYFRCGGWEWIPEEADEKARLVCSDGTILKIAEGGRAVCGAIESRNLLVYG
ncbi:ATP-NAD kinase-like domain-containing protein [Pisolithus sp. B1]|nr:ATP-NAD kinase-like domain-containing protein [Pisolithus sp. B1]